MEGLKIDCGLRILICEAIAQIERRKNEYTTEDSENIELFLKDLNSDNVSNAIFKHMREVSSNENLLHSSSESKFIQKVLKISFKERKEGKLGSILGLCSKFNVLTGAFLKTFVQMLYRIVFSGLMNLENIGIEELKNKVEEKKKKEAAQKSEDEKKLNDKKLEWLKRNKYSRQVNEDVLRYVGGFLARSLKWKGCPAEIMRNIEKKDEMLEEPPNISERWINLLDRGGLIKVQEGFYNLITRMKIISDKFYMYLDSESICNLRNQNLKENTLEAIIKDGCILQEWNKISTLHDEKLKWLKKTCETFLNTRGKVLVKDVLEHYQHETKESLKAKKALRKAIKEKSEASATKIKDITKDVINSPGKGRMSTPTKSKRFKSKENSTRQKPTSLSVISSFRMDSDILPINSIDLCDTLSTPYALLPKASNSSTLVPSVSSSQCDTKFSNNQICTLASLLRGSSTQVTSVPTLIKCNVNRPNWIKPITETITLLQHKKTTLPSPKLNVDALSRGNGLHSDNYKPSMSNLTRIKSITVTPKNRTTACSTINNSSQELPKDNDNDFSFLDDNPDKDLFLQYLPKDNDNEYSFLDDDPDKDLFFQFC